MRSIALEMSSLIAVVLMGTSTLAAEQSQESKFIRLQGRTQAVVTTPSVRLGDIADITSKRSSDDEAVIGLKRLHLDRSPQPGQSLTLSASEVLARMRKGGVDLDSVGYVLPRVIEIKRASRPLSEQELRAAIENYLLMARRDASIRKLTFPDNFQVFPGEIELLAQPGRHTSNGQAAFVVTVKTPQQEALSLDVLAQIDEWRDVPVAARALSRGALVEINDVAMARANIASLPRDIALSQEEIYGRRIETDLSSGGYFRVGQMEVAPLVPSGSRVTVMYRSGALEATATGMALEAGGLGQPIRVRNENSKKVIYGVVSAAGLVEIKP